METLGGHNGNYIFPYCQVFLNNAPALSEEKRDLNRLGNMKLVGVILPLVFSCWEITRYTSENFPNSEIR